MVSAPPSHQETDQGVEALIERAATRGECVVSALRIPFCLLLAVRFWACSPPWPARILNVATISLAMALSGWLLARVVRRRPIWRYLGVSVIVDVTVCFVSLLQTVLWPSDDHSGYTGMLSHPDIAGMLVVVSAAGLRLDVRWAVLSALSGVVSTAVVLMVDYRRFGPMWTAQRHEVVLFFIFVGAAGTLAIVTAVRTRALATKAAVGAMRLQRAHHEFASIVRDQHDARNLVSAATLHADLIQRELRDQHRSEVPPSRLFENLRDDLQAASTLMNRMGERAFGELSTLRAPDTVALEPVLVAAVATLRARFPTLSLVLECGEVGAEIPSHTIQVTLVGGRPSLERIVLNLVQNAAEGDGRRTAQRVSLACRAEGGYGVLEVRDDGPGFSPTLLASDNPSAFSTKPSGSGLGLQAIAHVVGLSGGRLWRGNSAGGGATVIIVLPRDSARAAPPVRCASAPA